MKSTLTIMDNTEIIKKYKYAVIASDIAIFTLQAGRLKVLLIKMKKDPYKSFWACPGGLVKAEEDIEKGAERILTEKTGLKNVYLDQFYTFGKVGRDPFGRVVSVAYLALIPSDNLSLKTSSDYEDVKWFEVKDLPDLAYDHKEIVKVALETLKHKLENTNIVYSLLNEDFAFSDLQKVYEIILDKKMDKRNFKRKILSLNLISESEKKRVGEANRPAQLYHFTNRKLEEVEVL